MQAFLDSITIIDFKAEFPRDFVYLPLWDADTLYFIGDQIYYDVDRRFYRALLQNENIMPNADPLTWEVYQDNILLYITDEMIQNALDKAKNFLQNNSCFLRGGQNQQKEIVLLLAAHYLYITATGDRGSGGGGLIEKSRTVGKVAQSFEVPEWLKNPIYAIYTKNPFGYEYITKLRALCYLSGGAVIRFDTPTLVNNWYRNGG